MTRVVRALIDPPLSGYENMSRDEALLETGSLDTPLTVRFFEWRENPLGGEIPKNHRNRF